MVNSHRLILANSIGNATICTVQTKFYYQSHFIENQNAYVIEEPKVLKFSSFLRTDAILFFDGYDAFMYEIDVLLSTNRKLNLFFFVCKIWLIRQFFKEISSNRFQYAGFFTIILTEYMDQSMITQMF